LQLENVGNNKDVKVIYITDNWATTEVVSAEFSTTCESNSNVEIWHYTYQSAENNIQYKLTYTINGTTYVDDNFGNYYTIAVY